MAKPQNPLNCYNPNTGMYTSSRPPISLPESPTTSIVDFLFRNLRTHSKFPALIDPKLNQTLTFAQLRSSVSNFAHTLHHEFNITKNDVVFIFSPNSILFPIAFFAVTSIGAVATTANPLYTVAEITHQIADYKPKLIITVDQLRSKFNGFNLPVINLNDYYTDLVTKPRNVGELSHLSGSVSQDDVAVILYSSGTTGLSKGVVLTHKSIIATSLMVTADQEAYNEGRSVFLCVVPLFHIMGLVTSTNSQLQTLGKDFMDECAKVFPQAGIFQVPMSDWMPIRICNSTLIHTLGDPHAFLLLLLDML